jgi:hypothetical protein
VPKFVEPISKLKNDIFSRHPGESRDPAFVKFSGKLDSALNSLWLLKTAGMTKMLDFELKNDFEMGSIDVLSEPICCDVRMHLGDVRFE